MSEANKKTPRSFQCRDALWTTFETMAGELECSVDYLINDAMKQYARQRGYTNEASQTRDFPPPSAPLSPNLQIAGAGAPTLGSPSSPPPARSGSATQPRAPLPPRPPTAGPAAPAPPHVAAPLPAAPAHPPAPPGSRMPPLPAQAGVGRPPVPPPPLGHAAPSALPRPPAPPQPRAPQVLTLHFQGGAFPVTKERFIIGRGKTSSDLTIRDPNVSRQHALVEFAGGAYYMVDMGSTNGIEFQGQRVQRKAIQNGDVFRICDYEIFCSMG